MEKVGLGCINKTKSSSASSNYMRSINLAKTERRLPEILGAPKFLGVESVGMMVVGVQQNASLVQTRFLSFRQLV
jgi:hypothetical protein